MDEGVITTKGVWYMGDYSKNSLKGCNVRIVIYLNIGNIGLQ